MGKVINFDNLSTDDALNGWIRESIEECKSTYPMVGGELPVAVDIGANVGGFCIYARNNFQKIYAFEPEAMNYAVLQSVKEHYQLDNVEIFNTAVYGKSNTELSLRSYSNNHSKEVTCAQFEHKDFLAIDQKCETISLADMMEALDLDRINYLKIDCEGSEYEILENFEDYHKISLIALEIHGFYGKKRKLDLLKRLSKHYHFADISKSAVGSLRDMIREVPSLKELQDQHIFFLIHKNIRGTRAS